MGPRRQPAHHRHASRRHASRRHARPATLTLALFLLLAAADQLSAAPVETAAIVRTVVSTTQSSRLHVTDLATSVESHEYAEPILVFGSGRRLAASAHRRILDTLRSKQAVTVLLTSGEERTYPSGADYIAHARSAELEGAQMVVPAETFPCELVSDVVETELALLTHMVMPTGEAVPYRRYMEMTASTEAAPATRQNALYHRQPHGWATPEDVPEDQLQVALGGSQRLSMKVHNAILRSYQTRQPVVCDLVTGKQATVQTYDELIRKMVDPKFIFAKVRLGGEVKVPISTYRAVVDAHRHKAVYVVDPDDHRMPYTEYVNRTKTSKRDNQGAPKKD